MSNIVIEDDLSTLAAEYVLGTLDRDERAHANVLLDVDHGFRVLVREWERRLGELHLMVEPVEPDGQVWERIKVKLSPHPEAVVPPPAISAEPPPAINPEPQSAAPLDATVHAERLAELVHEVERLADEVKTDAATPAAEAVSELTQSSAVLPVVPPQVEAATRQVEPEAAKAVRDDGRWRAVALLMTVVAIILSGLIAAWRFVPNRLPQLLRPTTVLNIPEVRPPPEQTPTQHGTQFEE